jgi:hypothetical protein
MLLTALRSEASLLKRALLANAVFSAIGGLLILFGDRQIARLLTEVEQSLWVIGAMLLGFSASLLWYSTRPAISSAWVTSVILADVAWVAGTVVLLLGWHELLTAPGAWILAIVGALVLLFADLQWFGLRRLKNSVIRASTVN